MLNNNEIVTKRQRLADFLSRHQLDAVLLWQRNNFAWITAGRDNHIANNSPQGVAAILATAESSTCFTNTIEAPRMRDEELAGTGIDVAAFPWWDRPAGAKILRELIAGRRVACDGDDLGLNLPPLPKDFAQLRWSLTDEEIARYRDGSRRASRAMEQACHDLHPGIHEHDAAGILDHHIHAGGCNPLVTLIASDERIRKFRHPIPTNNRIDRHVMLVTCAEFRGLISCLTRFVHFGPLPAELQEKQRAICAIDAAVNAATKPGRTLGEIFRDLQRAYADNGHADQWQHHHQGGSTGYAGREALATPDSDIRVLDDQAFAWNPSIVGAKSEDTILCTAAGIAVITQASQQWPTIDTPTAAPLNRRPGILVR